jgi:hypothetical protein
MPQIVTKSILSISFIIALFLLLVWSSNSTELTITSSSKTKQALEPELYYAQAGEAFSETKKIVGIPVSNEKFLFKLPYHFTSIKSMRYDPTKKSGDSLKITTITLIEREWFKESIYTIPLQHLTPLYHINKFTPTNNQTTFQTIGDDPQFSLDSKPTLVSSSYLSHLHYLIISFILYIILISLYRLSQKSDQGESTHTKLILYALFFAFTTFKVVYYKDNVRFSHPPDELAHLSYIHHVHTHSTIIPKYEESYILNRQKDGNYLSHPPLYYHIMNLAYNTNYSIRYNVKHFRELSATLFILSYLILLIVMFQTKLSLLSHLVYLTFITSIPMYAYLGGAITNDTLGILAAALFIYILQKILQHHYHTSVYLLLGLSIFIGFFSKLTVAMLMGFAGILFLLYVWRTKYPFQITKMQVSLIALFLLPILYYQLYIIFQYNSLMPSLPVTHPELYLKSHFYIPVEHRQQLTPWAWLERMLHYIQGGWFGIHSHHSVTKESPLGFLGLLVLHFFALVALFSKCDEKEKAYCLLGKLTLTALFIVLFIQYLFSYQTHLNSGYMSGLQPRYVLPFLAAFAIMASIFVEKMNKSFWLTIVILTICIHAIYSDFFYFLQYYK